MISLIFAPVECRSRFMTIFVLATFMLAAALPAIAGTVNVFGPEVFVRSTGKPDVIDTTFKLPPGVSQCQIIVTGADGGPLAANNVAIQVNGVEMPGSKDLRENNQQQRPVTLQAENSLAVTLKGKPGDAVTVTITGVVEDGVPVKRYY
jgi:hypothetical protein